MLPEEVETGQTYRVHIANRDNPAHLLACTPEHSEANLALFAETLDATVHFAELAERNIELSDLTVVATGQLLGTEPAVTGIRVSETSRVRTPLPTETAERLGLPTTVSYFVEGVLKDRTGQVVSLPANQTLTVPARWLHPLP
jgi:hypothetical protein